MAGTMPRKAFAERLASSAVRGTNAGTPGARKVRRAIDSQAGGDESRWVEVEAEADIVPKPNPYISFDPAGSYP